MSKALKKIIYLSLFNLVIISSISCGKSGAANSSKITSDNKIEISSGKISNEKISSDYDSEREESSESEIFALDTAITLKVYGSKGAEVLKKLEDKINELDGLLSTGKATSEVSKLNDTGKAVLSETSISLVKKSLELNKQTGGLFDITIYPLMELWGFPSKNYKVPSDKEIKTCKKRLRFVL